MCVCVWGGGGGYLTITLSTRVEYLNGILAPWGRDLNKPICKSSDAWEARGGGGLLSYIFIGALISCVITVHV